MKDKLEKALNWLKDKYVAFADWSDENPKKARLVRIAAVFGFGFIAGALVF